MKVVIMAGGRGTRISSLFPNIPKPMIPLTSEEGITKPVLEWEICSLRDQGFRDIVITVSYMANIIMEYFNDGSDFGVHIEYFVEKTPLGNAGALYKLNLEGDFLLLNADALMDIDFNRLVSFHQEKDALITLFTHPNSHPYDSGLIIADADGRVCEWLTKEDERPIYYNNRVNAGIHVLNGGVLQRALVYNKLIPSDIGTEVGGKIVKVDLDRQILKPLCATGRVFCYDSPEYVRDMGTIDRFHVVSRDFQAGVVARKNLLNKQRAIFLDRDGTINKYVGFLRNIDEFELLDGVAEAIARINEMGYLCIVVTNQPVIARGEMKDAELQEIHKKMETELGKKGAYIDALFFCPHHPHRGYEGEISELKIMCECRKPKPGMLLKAAKKFNIDLNESWMIGDSENDILAGNAAGCKTAFIGKEDHGQMITVDSLLEFTSIVFA